jgi:hypothetical protein
LRSCRVLPIWTTRPLNAIAKFDMHSAPVHMPVAEKWQQEMEVEMQLPRAAAACKLRYLCPHLPVSMHY